MDELIVVRFKEHSVKPALVYESLDERDLESERMPVPMGRALAEHRHLASAESLRCFLERVFILRCVGS